MRAMRLVLVVLALAFGACSSGSTSSTPSLADVALPEGWSRLKLTEAERDRGLIFKVGRNTPPASATVRRVKGDLADDIDLEAVARRTEAALQKASTGFVPISRAVSQVGGVEVPLMVWDAQGDDGEATRSTMAILPTARASYYVTIRSAVTDAAAVRADGDKLLGDVVAELSS